MKIMKSLLVVSVLVLITVPIGFASEKGSGHSKEGDFVECPVCKGTGWIKKGSDKKGSKSEHPTSKGSSTEHSMSKGSKSEHPR